MRSPAPQVRCDPTRLERIRLANEAMAKKAEEFAEKMKAAKEARATATAEAGAKLQREKDA